jgi:hypothetical protein
VYRRVTYRRTGDLCEVLKEEVTPENVEEYFGCGLYVGRK